jgi:hypothetical protein
VAEPATPTNMRNRRKRLRWAAALGVLLLAFAGGVTWWAFYVPPLTEEEQRFVGYWTSPRPEKPMTPAERRANPIETLAVEYRADRELIWHRHDTRTGDKFAETFGRWTAKDGQLMETYSQRYQVGRLLRGEVRQPLQTYVYRVVWENPDRFVTDRIDIPSGVWWPTTVHLRCPPPEYP